MVEQALLYLTALRRCSMRRVDRFSAAMVVPGPLVICLIVLLVLVTDGVAERIYDDVDALILSEAETSSGVQRSYWNALALQSFFASWGLGVGLGTDRTSIVTLAILAPSSTCCSSQPVFSVRRG